MGDSTAQIRVHHVGLSWVQGHWWVEVAVGLSWVQGHVVWWVVAEVAVGLSRAQGPVVW